MLLKIANGIGRDKAKINDKLSEVRNNLSL